VEATERDKGQWKQQGGMRAVEATVGGMRVSRSNSGRDEGQWKQQRGMRSGEAAEGGMRVSGAAERNEVRGSS
jgi:hypothetical protein